MASAKRAGLLLLAVTLAVGPEATAGPITFLTALPVAQDQGVLRVQYLRVRATDDPTPLGRELTVDALPVVVAMGLNARLAAFVAVPYLDKSIELTTPGGRVSRGASGIGDTLLLARYTAFAHDEPGATLRIAPFLGVKAPTGSHNESDRFGRLPQPLQAGSGSWDGIAGVAFTRQTLAWELDADAAYRVNGEADRFRFGNEALADVSFQYRVWPRQLAEDIPSFIYAVVESNLDWRERDELNGVPDPGSGGSTLDLVLGLQYVREKYILEAAVRRPVVQNLRAGALQRDYELTFGFRLNFSLPFSQEEEQ